MKMKAGYKMKAVLARCRERAAQEGGFSIIELLVASLLLFVITFGAINFADQGTSLARASVSSAEVNQEWRETVESMTRQIRVAYYFVAANDTSISFCSYAKGDNVAYRVSYRLSGTNLQSALTLANTAPVEGSYSTVASGVENLRFTYYDDAGSSGAATTEIRRVEVFMRIARGYNREVATFSEGHTLEQVADVVRAEGAESVTVRNTLTAAP